MPYDGAQYETPITGRERLAILAKALRGPMPAGFKWNWDYDTNCAMGLVDRLWPGAIAAGPRRQFSLRAFLGIDEERVDYFFMTAPMGFPFGGWGERRVIAGRIDRYLKQRALQLA